MNYYPPTRALSSVSIILPVMNETVSLRQTVEVILRLAPMESICELLVVVCTKTTPAAMQVVSELKAELPDLIVVHCQQLPFLGGAVREAFELARGSHVLLMASDLETDPRDVPILIEEARKNPESLVTASRWMEPGRFNGYFKIKLVCNWIFQHFFAMLYGARLTDLTFAYRIFPAHLVKSIRWEELRHPFLFETLVKPLRLGVTIKEVSSAWAARIEGESQNPFWRNFAYFRTGLKTRFSPRRSLLRSPS